MSSGLSTTSGVTIKYLAPAPETSSLIIVAIVSGLIHLGPRVETEWEMIWAFWSGACNNAHKVQSRRDSEPDMTSYRRLRMSKWVQERLTKALRDSSFENHTFRDELQEHLKSCIEMWKSRVGFTVPHQHYQQTQLLESWQEDIASLKFQAFYISLFKHQFSGI